MSMNIRTIGSNTEKKIFIAHCKPLTRYGLLSGEERNQKNRLLLLGDTGSGSLENINICIANFIKNNIQLPATQHLLASVNSNSMATCFDRLFGCRQTSTLHKR